MQKQNNAHRPLFVFTLVALSASAASAGGLDRSGQNISPLFENGGYAEVGIATVKPTVKGVDVLGFKTGNVADSFVPVSFAIKQDLNPQLSYAVILDQPFGADISYATASEGGSVMLGGTSAEVKTQALSGLARYKFNNAVSVHGGLRVEQASGKVSLGGLAYGPLNGYTAVLSKHTGMGYVLGASYEKPEIALRISGTYYSAVKHEFGTVENILPGSTVTRLDTPQAFNLNVSTGVAENTLVFGGVRWAEWESFKMRPAAFSSATGGASLTNIATSKDFTLGVARKFNDTWSGVTSVGYRKKGLPLVSPLDPTGSATSLSVAAIYTVDKLRVTTGLSYTKYGSSQAQTSGQPRATFSGNKVLALGVKLGYSF